MEKKIIWFLNQNSYLPEDGPHTRHYALAKYLVQKGYEPFIFAGNELHHNGRRIDTHGELFVEKIVNGVHFLYVRTTHYEKNDHRRAMNIASYYRNVFPACRAIAKKYGSPDIIYASCMYPTAIAAGIKLAKKYNIKCISESRDIVPEGFVKDGALKEKSLIAKAASAYMKRLYYNSDSLVFTFSGGKEYIRDKGWDIGQGGRVDLNKVHYINNGVDLDDFNQNAKAFVLPNKDLDDSNTKCVVYFGAIRFMNNMPLFLDTAKALQNKERNDIKILLWGTGTKMEEVQKAIDEAYLKNISLEGYVDKKYIPGIAKRADLFIGTGNSTNLKYGMSFNKLFDYLAGGKPIILPFKSGNSIVEKNRAGTEIENATGETIADEIIRYADMDRKEYGDYCQRVAHLAESFDYKKLADEIDEIVKKTM